MDYLSYTGKEAKQHQEHGPFKDVLKFFKENKIRIDGYKFFCGVRVVSLEIGGLNNDCYNLYLRV